MGEGEVLKVIIGAGKTNLDGWLSTQESELNLLDRNDFEKMFGDEKPTAFLAEHVWEHMTYVLDAKKEKLT